MRMGLALGVALAACWDAWRLLAGRIEGEASAATLVALVALLGWRAWGARREAVSPRTLGVGLAAYAVACWTGPALLQIGAAIGVQVALLWRRERWPVIGLALLALPVLPTLDFLLAWPLRRLSAILTGALLRLNGVAVGIDGVAIEWQGQRLLFDGACSGVRMLWASLLLASVLAIARGLGVVRYAGLLALAVGIAIAANALRAASLFYLENGFVAPLGGPIAHEAVGIAAFAMVVAAMLAVAQPMRRRPA